MSKASNSISIFHYADSESKKPFSIKISYTQEIYHGSELKERLELSKHTELSDYPYHTNDPKKDISLLPRLEINSDNITTTEEEFNRSENFKIEKRVKDNMKSPVSEYQREGRNYIFWLINIVAVVFISIFLWRYTYISNYFLSQSIPIDKIEKELYANVFNQNTSIATIISNLQELNQFPPKKILTCIIGTNGVGKTYVANILSKQLNSNNIDIFHRSDLSDLCNRESSFSKKIRIKLYFSEYFIIVLDDLNYDDLDALRLFINMTFAIEDTSILILTIFNIQMESCLDYENVNNPSLIRTELNNSSQNFYFINFQSLDALHVKLWLRRAIQTYDVESVLHNEIINSVLKSHDVRCQGLKGLHSKLLAELTERQLL